MSLYDDVQRYLHYEKTNVWRNDIDDAPPGWHPIIIKMFDFLEIWQPEHQWIDRLFVDQHSLLRMEVLDRRNPVNNYTNMVAQSLAGQSAYKCMITGQRGWRRKQAPGKPALNNELYVQYMNECDIRGLLHHDE